MIKLEHGQWPLDLERAELDIHPLCLPSAALIEDHCAYWRDQVQKHEQVTSGLIREVPNALVARLGEVAGYKQIFDQNKGHLPRVTKLDAQRLAASTLAMSGLMRLPNAASTMETSLATADEEFLEYALDRGDDFLRWYVKHGREGNFVEDYRHDENDGSIVWYEHRDEEQGFFVRTEQTDINHVTDAFLDSYMEFFGDYTAFDSRSFTTITPIMMRMYFEPAE